MKKINLEDIVQVCIGSAMLAIPIAFTEEAWNMANTLPTFKVILILFTSLLMDACFIYYGVYEGNIRNKGLKFTTRILINYLLTMGTVAYILYILDILSLQDSPFIWLTKSILISFPASLSGAIADSFDKE